MKAKIQNQTPNNQVSHDKNGLFDDRRHLLRSLFLFVLALLVGFAFIVSIEFYLHILHQHPALFVSEILITATLVYVVLSRFLWPVWSGESHVLRGAISGIAICTTLLATLFIPSAQAASALDWKLGIGSQTGQSASVLVGESWHEAAQQYIELHADDAVNGTRWGIGKIYTGVPESLSQSGGMVRFTLTQPDWAVINPDTGQPAPEADGVLIVFTVDDDSEQHIVQELDINPFAKATQRKWMTVDVPIPAGARRLNIELKEKQTIYNDRVWISPGEVKVLWSDVTAPAQWIVILFLSSVASVIAWRTSHISPFDRIVHLGWRAFERYGWLITGTVSLVLAYLLIWQRGMFLDDYSAGDLARDPTTGQWLPLNLSSIPTFPARLLTWIVTPRIVALLWTHELLVRIALALCVGINALLLGWLVYRILGSRLAATISGWLFIAPIYTDVGLWPGAATYLFITGLTLLLLHTSWTVLTIERRPYVWIAGGAVIFIVSLFFAEACIAAVGFIPLLGFIYAVQHPRSAWRNIFIRTVLATGPLIIILGLFYTFILRASTLIASRGGSESNPIQLGLRIIAYLKSFWWWAGDTQWGWHFTVEATKIGIAQSRTSFGGMALLVGIVLLILLTAFTWKSAENTQNKRNLIGWLVLVLGIIWFIATLTVPYILAKGQMYERRFAYFPTAGLAIACGSLAWLIARAFRHSAWEKTLAGIGGILLVATTLCTVGYAQIYAARYQTDQNQLAALLKIVPSEDLPPNSQIVPVQLNYMLPGTAAGLSVIPVGVFESPWTICSELRRLYRRNDMQFIVKNRWVPEVFSYTNQPAFQVPDPQLLSCGSFASNPDTLTNPQTELRLYTQQFLVRPEQTVLFTQVQDETLLVKRLVVVNSDGTKQTIDFPIVAKLAALGRPTISEIVVKNTP
jgi:hypothetical protein